MKLILSFVFVIFASGIANASSLVCSKNSDCPSSIYTCTATTAFPVGSCILAAGTLPVGSYCSNDNHCVSGYSCISGLCASYSSANPGDRCTSSSQCAGDYYCSMGPSGFGMCLPMQSNSDPDIGSGGSCSASWQCSGSLLCRSGICVDFDEPDGSRGYGSSCTGSWQCSGDLICRGGTSDTPGSCQD